GRRPIDARAQYIATTVDPIRPLRIPHGRQGERVRPTALPQEIQIVLTARVETHAENGRVRDRSTPLHQRGGREHGGARVELSHRGYPAPDRFADVRLHL